MCIASSKQYASTAPQTFGSLRLKLRWPIKYSKNGLMKLFLQFAHAMKAQTKPKVCSINQTLRSASDSSFLCKCCRDARLRSSFTIMVHAHAVNSSSVCAAISLERLALHFSTSCRHQSNGRVVLHFFQWWLCRGTCIARSRASGWLGRGCWRAAGLGGGRR